MSITRNDDVGLGADDEVGANAQPDEGRIAAELAALGEDPLGAAELQFVATQGATLSDPDVATTDTLIGLGHPPTLLPLDELAVRRVWGSVAGRTGTVGSSAAPPVTHGASSTNPVMLRTVLAGFAVAASLVLVPRLGPQTDRSPEVRQADQEALSVLGDQARAGLAKLPGDADTERATSLADDYAARLAARTRGGRGE